MERITFTLGLIGKLLIVIVLIPLLPLLISGNWLWWEAWVYAGVFIVGFLLSRFLAARRSPDILAERARSMNAQDALPWDRVLAPLTGIGGGVIPLTAGLDARYGWSPAVSPAAELTGLLLLLAGYALSTCALVENRFFSGVVRIQSDRGHTVVTGGPYRWLRHPGYAGALLAYLTVPLLLSALWAFIPAGAMLIILVIRTRLEDLTLQEQLPGYREYARSVRYRLIPGIW
jgi:protein-S-isoprenylcysteine O-methyltransferase Ste14